MELSKFFWCFDSFEQIHLDFFNVWSMLPKTFSTFLLCWACEKRNCSGTFGLFNADAYGCAGEIKLELLMQGSHENDIFYQINGFKFKIKISKVGIFYYIF